VARTAIIFGHTSGLGRAIADTLLARDYEVIGVARSASPSHSPHLTQIGLDLSDVENARRAADEIRQDHPKFDVMVYCAGVLTAHELGAVSAETLTHLYQVNLFAPMIIQSRLLGLIEQNGATVVNVTSSSVHDYYPKFTEYSTAKSAFVKFTDDLRRRLEPTAARVVELCPSGFTSNMYRDMSGDKIARDESRQIDAADIAELLAVVLELPERMEVGRLVINRK
jgi:short-subunit dehydrogenase